MPLNTRNDNVLVDRGKTGLVISIACSADEYDTYAPLFQAAVESIELL